MCSPGFRRHGFGRPRRWTRCQLRSPLPPYQLHNQQPSLRCMTGDAARRLEGRDLGRFRREWAPASTRGHRVASPATSTGGGNSRARAWRASEECGRVSTMVACLGTRSIRGAEDMTAGLGSQRRPGPAQSFPQGRGMRRTPIQARLPGFLHRAAKSSCARECVGRNPGSRPGRAPLGLSLCSRHN
jgi:hypothetical protein